MVNHQDNTERSTLTSHGEANDPELVEGPGSNESWFVYICESKSRHYYVGISPNPVGRVSKHNSSSGAKMAKDQGGFELLYVSNPFPNKSAARRREIQLKGWTREKKEKLIIGSWN